MGFSRSIQVMVKEVENKFAGLKLFISVVHRLEETIAQSVLNKVKKLALVAQEAIVPVTAVLGVHTGPGLVGIVVYDV